MRRFEVVLANMVVLVIFFAAYYGFRPIMPRFPNVSFLLSLVIYGQGMLNIIIAMMYLLLRKKAASRIFLFNGFFILLVGFFVFAFFIH